MQDYVCKHALNGNAVNLICEYIAASFLMVWELSVPDFCFINVNYEHVKHLAIPKYHVDKTCFGSKFNKNFVECCRQSTNIYHERSEYLNGVLGAGATMTEE